MKRLQFLAALFGGAAVAKAQTSLPVSPSDSPKIWTTVAPYSQLSGTPPTTLPKPANGECPVFGTKFKPKAAADDDGEPYIHGCRHCRCLYYIEVE